MFIYKIQNKINGKIYIGKTTHDIEIRFWQHNKASKSEKNDSALHRAIRKYGIQSFDISVVDVTNNKKVLNEKEKHWIKFYDSKANGYNMTYGGDGGDLSKYREYHPHTEETKEKIREKRKLQVFTIETRKKLSKSNKGKNLGRKASKETRKKLSESHKGQIPWIKGKKLPYKERGPRPDMMGENNPAKRPEVKKKLSENNAMKRPEVVEKFIKSRRRVNNG